MKTKQLHTHIYCYAAAAGFLPSLYRIYTYVISYHIILGLQVFLSHQYFPFPKDSQLQ